jgi:hypothetical protein
MKNRYGYDLEKKGTVIFDKIAEACNRLGEEEQSERGICLFLMSSEKKKCAKSGTLEDHQDDN